MKLVLPGKFHALADGLAQELDRPADVQTLADLMAWLGARRPALGEAMKASRARVIVNHAVVHDLLHAIADNDEIAFLPPMSGG